MSYASYNGLSEQERTVILPDIKKGKTLYWIWGDEVMPVIFWGVCGGYVDDNKKFHIKCEMRTKKRREFPYTSRGKSFTNVYEKGDKRYFSGDNIGKSVFFTAREAKDALAGITEAAGTAKDTV
jgi:hypothetical protein